MKEAITLVTLATLAVFGAKAAHELAGGKDDALGIVVQIAGGVGGIWLGKKLS